MKRRGDDRLSELPQPILHHILSLLPQKDAVQTCVWSKPWRFLWCARPKLEFSEGCPPWKGKLVHVVDKLLKRYQDQNLSMEEFILDVPGVQPGICSYIEKWISMLISLGGVKTFNLRFVSERDDLPQELFLDKSLQKLKMFKNLQTLCLSYVSIEEKTFENIMSSCPLIQCLVIHKCKRLRTIKVSNAHNLKNFDCDNSYVIHREWPDRPETVCPSIDFDAPTTLQSIRIKNCHTLYWHNDNRFFLNLKSVHMYNVRLPSESFDIFSSYNSPCLEDLELSDCYGFNEMELSSRSIKRLIIMKLSISAAAIDTPNILYFKLSFGSDVPSPFSFTKNSSCDWKSDICVSCYFYVSLTRLRKLNVVLKALSQSQISLDIGCRYIMNHLFEDTYKGFNEPVVVEHMSLRGSFPLSFFPDFLNYLFRNICRPRCINDSQIELENIEGEEICRESLCKVLVQEIEKMDCLWLQDLEDISTEELIDSDNDDAEEWLHFLDSSLSKKKNPTSIEMERVKLALA